MNNSLQLWDGNLSIITRPVPHVSSPNEVIIKVAYSGVCGTDLHILAGEFPAAKCVVLGHEFSGVVSDIGSEVRNVSIGDRVVVNPSSNCNTCRPCRRGQPHFCETGSIRSSIGVWRNGGWSQYSCVPASNVHVIPLQVSLRQAALCEPISCILHGFNLLQPLASDSKILVCGSGIIGLLWLCILHFHGYRKVTVSEISEERRSLALGLSLGYKVLHPDAIQADAAEAIQSRNDNWGFDNVIDCTGNPLSIEKAVTWLTHGGRLLLFGCCPKDSEMKINPFEIYRKELKIIGSLVNPFTFPQAVELVRELAEEYLDYDKLGIVLFDLINYESAINQLRKGVIAKSVFKT